MKKFTAEHICRCMTGGMDKRECEWMQRDGCICVSKSDAGEKAEKRAEGKR